MVIYFTSNDSVISSVIIVRLSILSFCSFFFNDTPTPEIYTLSLHDALPICAAPGVEAARRHAATDPTRPAAGGGRGGLGQRSEEHTSELQSRFDLVCRLLLEKKKKKKPNNKHLPKSLHITQYHILLFHTVN